MLDNWIYTVFLSMVIFKNQAGPIIKMIHWKKYPSDFTIQNYLFPESVSWCEVNFWKSSWTSGNTCTSKSLYIQLKFKELSPLHNTFHINFISSCPNRYQKNSFRFVVPVFTSTKNWNKITGFLFTMNHPLPGFYKYLILVLNKYLGIGRC